MKKQIHGGDIYTCRPKADFSANINPLGVPDRVRQAVADCIGDLANYPDPACRKLRRAVAEFEKVPGENLIFGNGAAELIFAAAFAKKPKQALLLAPGFAEYEQALEAAGCAVRFYDLREKTGFYPGEDYFDRITEDLDMAFLCSPNNPTGVCLRPEFLLRAAERCREKGVLLVLDECFNGFLDDPEACSMKRKLAAYPNLLILKAFTKLYAMPGLRLGYAMSADRELLGEMERMLQPWNVSLPAQEAGTAALGEKAYVEEARNLIKKERVYLTEGLGKLGFTVFEPSANFIFFKGPVGLADFCKARGYLIRDCKNYRGLSEGYYRIAVRRHEENTALLDVMAEAAGRNSGVQERM